MNVHPSNLRQTPQQRGTLHDRAIRMPLMVSLQRRRLQCYLALMVCDAVALFVSFGLVGYVYLGQGAAGSVLLAQLLLPVYLTIALYNGTYSLASLQSLASSVGRGLMALAVSASVVLFSKRGLEAADQAASAIGC